MANIVPCEPNTKCLDEVKAAIGGAAGLSGRLFDSVSRNITKFCDNPIINEKFKEEVLKAAARTFVAPAQLQISIIARAINGCFGGAGKVGEWITAVANILGGLSSAYGGGDGYLYSIIRLMDTYYNANLITNLCAPGGVKDAGRCAALSPEAPACLTALAPWLIGNCLTKSGFTASSLFQEEPDGWVPKDGVRHDLVIACNGLVLTYEIVKDEFPGIECNGVFKYKLEGGGWTEYFVDFNGERQPTIIPPIILLSGEKRYKGVVELNGQIKAVATEVKTKAKEQLRKSYELLFGQIKIAYSNKLKYLNKLKSSITYNVNDGLGAVVDHILGEVGGLKCSAEAKKWWDENGIGNTDACFQALKDRNVTFADDVAPVGHHNIPITEPVAGATEVEVPSPGGNGFQMMPWPPTPGPRWDQYVAAHTQQKDDAHNQCSSARIQSWRYNVQTGNIEIIYKFNPSAAWVTNTATAKAIEECRQGKIPGGKIGPLERTLKNLVTIFNKTRGPCGQSPLYSLISAASPEVGNNQYIGFDSESCTYFTPGFGVKDPARGGDWPPANQPGNPGGVGVPLPDDCAYYPVFVGTAQRQELGIILPVYQAILRKLVTVSISWDKTAAEIETWIKNFEATVDQACS